MSESEIQVLGMPIAGEFFHNHCRIRTQIINEIINEIEIQKRRKTAAGDILFTAVVTVCIQIMNQTVKEIDIQEREKPAACEFFYNICHSRKHTINEIMSESEIQLRKPVAGEIFYNIFESHTNN